MKQNPSSNANNSSGCGKIVLYVLAGLTAFVLITGGYRWVTNTDTDWDRLKIESLREAVKDGNGDLAKQYLSEFKTDSFREIAEQEFPNIDLLIEKKNTAPYTVVESIRYPQNQAGISALVHTVLVDSLYLDDVETVVVPRLSKQFDDGNGHQIYLHETQPLELKIIAREKDRLGVIKVAKKGAFGYVTRSKGTEAFLMGVNEKGDYVDY
jgi:hypothetical protein